MQTVITSQIPEYVALQDLADALEACIPTDRDPITLIRFQHELMVLGGRDLGDALNRADILASIHHLGAEMIKASSRWPKRDSLHAVVAEREQVRKDCTAVVEDYLANYDAKRYMSVMAAIAQTNHPGFLSIKRRESFYSDDPIDDSDYQEAAAFIKWDLHHKTQSEVAPPGPSEVFDPIHVTIERRWQSATQLTTAIAYAGVEMGNYQDNAIIHPLGHYVPAMGEAEAIKLARKVFYHGHDGAGIKPHNASSLGAMIEQVEKDYQVALQDDAMHSVDKLTLSTIPERLARFKGQIPAAQTQSYDSPGI